jgi:hypothetical protein
VFLFTASKRPKGFHKLGVGSEFCGKIAASIREATQLMPVLRCNLPQHPIAISKSH